jgi:hypothetical protein
MSLDQMEEEIGDNDSPRAVSAISHSMMLDWGIPTSLASCTAPLPQRPSYSIVNMYIAF